MRKDRLVAKSGPKNIGQRPLYEDEDGKLYVAENDGSIDVIQHDRVIKNPALSLGKHYFFGSIYCLDNSFNDTTLVVHDKVLQMPD